jgi:hypothetical protein
VSFVSRVEQQMPALFSKLKKRTHWYRGFWQELRILRVTGLSNQELEKIEKIWIFPDTSELEFATPLKGNENAKRNSRDHVKFCRSSCSKRI